MILATAAYYGYLPMTADRWVDAAEVTASVQEKLKDGWHASLCGLSIAERDQKPVLVDMWATWCKNCGDGSDHARADESVKRALDGYVKIVSGRGTGRGTGQLDNGPPRRDRLTHGVILHPKTATDPAEVAQLTFLWHPVEDP